MVHAKRGILSAAGFSPGVPLKGGGVTAACGLFSNRCVADEEPLRSAALNDAGGGKGPADDHLARQQRRKMWSVTTSLNHANVLSVVPRDKGSYDAPPGQRKRFFQACCSS
jgi:hypothetical protein